MVWEKLERGAEKIRAAARNSVLLGAAVGKPEPLGEIRGARIAFHHAVLELADQSRLLKICSRVRKTLLSVELQCYGIFFLLFGGVAILIPLLAGKDFSLDFFSFGAVAFGFPLCFLRFTVAEGLEHSELARLFLNRYCGFSDLTCLFQTGKRPVWRFAFAGVAAGSLAALIGANRILLLFLIVILVSVAFSVPEAILPPILFLFPFLGLFGHASLLLGALAGFSLICRLPKLFSGHRQDRFGKLDWIVILILLLLIFDGIVSAAGVDGGGVLLALYLAAAWFALRPALLSEKWKNRIFFSFLLSGAICSFLGILQYFSGKAEQKWLEIGRFDLLGGRVSATFSNPNFLAVYLLAVFGVSLGWTFSGRKNRLFGLAPLLLSSGCLVLTWTRGAWLGALAATAFFLLFRSSASLAALLVSPLSVFGIYPFLPEGIRARFGSIGNLAETSSHYRIETWKSVLRLIRAHPFGIGSGEATFHLIYPVYAVSGTESVMHAHNVYLQIAVEHGLFGLLLFLLLLTLLFRGFFSCWRQGIRLGDRSLFLGIAAALTGLLTMGFFDHLWYQPSLFFLFAALAAGLSAFTLCEEEKNDET